MATSTVSVDAWVGDERNFLRTDAQKLAEDKRKAKNACAQKAWRERLKADPERYIQFRKADSERVKAHRHNLTDEKRKQYNERTRLRMIKYQQKKKEEGIKQSRKSVTGATCEKQWKKWREEKRQQREALTSQKRRCINERRRKLYAEKKVKSNSNIPDKENANSSSTCIFKSDGAWRQAIHRTLKILPKDPNKFAEVVTSIIHKTTPKRKAALTQKCLISPQSKKRLEFYDRNVMKSKEMLKEIKKRSTRDNRLSEWKPNVLQ